MIERKCCLLYTEQVVSFLTVIKKMKVLKKNLKLIMDHGMLNVDCTLPTFLFFSLLIPVNIKYNIL